MTTVMTVSAGTLLLCERGHAQQAPPRFRVTDLRNLGSQLTAQQHGTMGINNKGQVVYAYNAGSTQSPLYHAWVWLPQAEYGYSANTIHTIDSTSNSSIARDINESGKIAGYSGNPRKATMWTLASGSASVQTLSGDSPSEAHALNNDSTPRLVGYRTIDDEEICAPTEFYEEAISWVPGNSATSLASVHIHGPFSMAFDVRRNGTEVAVGDSSPCRPWNACLPGQRGTSWTSGSGAQVGVGTIRQLAAGNDRESHPYGINDDTQMVGWVQFKPTETIHCFPTAAFWESPSDTDPVDLADFINGDISRAYAINNLNGPQVVGENSASLKAILWEYGTSWTATNLNTSPSVIAECSDNEWDITEAHDINDNGWIVALGERIVNNVIEYHALLLTPVTCPFDADNDGDVDEDDVIVISIARAACSPAVICRTDVNSDCVTDEHDVDAVLEYLNSCDAPCPCEGESFAGGGGLSIERFAEAIATFQPTLTEEEAAFAWQRFLMIYNGY